MPRLLSYLFCFATLTAMAGLTAQNATAAETDPDGKLYAASADALGDVEQALGRARDNDRLALVVVGGDWCHDSRALAARLHRSPLSEVIEQDYELVFVDVGYLDKARDVLQHYGVSHFYATPTVLILDPATGAVINNEDRHLWRNAYNVDMPTSVDYFEKWAAYEATAETVPVSPQLQALNAKIDAFELELADRVAAGYAVVGPMLAAYKEDKAPENFDSSWDELAGLRMAIPGAIQELRAEAERRVAAGEENIELDYPEFAPLSWEAE